MIFGKLEIFEKILRDLLIVSPVLQEATQLGKVAHKKRKLSIFFIMLKIGPESTQVLAVKYVELTT